jgi:N-acetylglucosamine transport system substrate-binding protein
MDRSGRSTEYRPGAVGRRDFLRLAAAAGVVVVPAGVLSACGSPASSPASSSAIRPSRANPFGVNPSQPLDVFIFDGGYGHAYGQYDVQLYEAQYPHAAATFEHSGNVAAALQSRFVGQNPPDVVDFSGNAHLDVATLIQNGQVSDLTELFSAPSIDDPAKTVADTLYPQTIALSQFGSKPYILNYVWTVLGIWNSRTLFQKYGWETPKTWDEMLSLSVEIKKAGMAPWTFQGDNSGYIISPILASAAKLGGPDILVNMDNLEANAWANDAVITAGDRWSELQSKNLMLGGTMGMTNIQSETYWTQGKAAFLPCGTWLRNEIRNQTPTDFDMVIAPTPSLTASDAMPYTAIQAAPDEGFIVPASAKNAPGGLEFLRIMLGKSASSHFSSAIGSLTVLKGYAETLTDSALVSSNAATVAAGPNTLYRQFDTWYPEAEQAVENATTQLMAGQITAKQWAAQCQQAADQAKADTTIAHPHRAA